MKDFIKKFSISELTANENGKTSPSATIGVFISFIGGICFLMGCVDKMWLNKKDVDILVQSIIFTTLGISLLGVRRINSKQKTDGDKSI